MTKQRNDSERTRVFNLLKDQGSLTSTMVSDALNMPLGKAKYYLTALTNEGKLRSLGRGVNGGYTLAKKPYTRKAKPVIADPAVIDQATLDLVQKEQDHYTEWAKRDKASREELVETVNVLSDAETMSAITQAENWDKAKNPYTRKTKDLSLDALERGDIAYPDLKNAILDNPAHFISGKFSTQLQDDVKHVTLNPDMFDKVKHLPFPVGVAALALLDNDVVTAQRMLSLTEV